MGRGNIIMMGESRFFEIPARGVSRRQADCIIADMREAE